MSRPCEQCGESFEPNRSDQRFCSKRCGVNAGNAHRREIAAKDRAARRCLNCEGPLPVAVKTGPRPKYCSETCKQKHYRATRVRCGTCRAKIPRGKGAITANVKHSQRVQFCSWRCRLLWNVDDLHNYSLADAAHVAALDLQQIARDMPVFGPVEIDEEQDDDGVSMAPTESAPIGSPFEDEYGKPIRHTRTDWSREQHRYEEEHGPY